MKSKFLVTGLLLLLGSTDAVLAQRASTRGKVISPQSNSERREDIGVRAHTNVELMIPSGSGPNIVAPGTFAAAPASTTPAAGFVAETPASLGCVYFLVSTRIAGCNPTTATLNPSGGSKVIAIVDAFDDPNAASDLAAFSAQFGLPAANFSKVFASGVKPAQDPTGGWELEASLDIEWAHAMAPSAKIVLVEAASNSLSSLLAAETVAANLVAAGGGGEVSNSWGGAEFAGETSLDSSFIKSGVVFFASTGDSPGTQWPGVSPNVVAAGGTTISRNPSTLAFTTERPWAETGGGHSLFETIPTYQAAISAIVGNSRGVPDLAFDADPDTGAWVLTALRSRARPPAVVELEAGGSWVEPAYLPPHWRVSSTQPVTSVPPVTANSPLFTAISATPQIFTTSSVITADRLLASPARRAGIFVPALAVFTAKPESNQPEKTKTPILWS